MNPDPYSPLVRRLFAAPVHAGLLEPAAVVQFDDQAIRIELSARAAGGSITALGFRAWACPHVIAAAEAFCAQYDGRPIADLDDFTGAEIMRTLPIPAEKTGRILVLEDAVRALGSALDEFDETTD